VRDDRRRISPSGNCPNWYRRRFSWLAGSRTGAGIGPAASMAVKTAQAEESELVTEADPDGVDVGFDIRRHALIFVFEPGKQSAHHHEVEAEARGVAIDGFRLGGRVPHRKH